MAHRALIREPPEASHYLKTLQNRKSVTGILHPPNASPADLALLNSEIEYLATIRD